MIPNDIKISDLPINERIEYIVTHGRRYGEYVERGCLENTEVGAQVSLVVMETKDEKLSHSESLELADNITNILNRYKKADLSINSITTASGFDDALTNEEHRFGIMDIFREMLKSVSQEYHYSRKFSRMLINYALISDAENKMRKYSSGIIIDN